MRIGDKVVRINGEFNQSVEGDVRIIKALKIYNSAIEINLEGDKPDTWHALRNFRHIEDVDMPCLEAKLTDIADKVKETIAKSLKTRKTSKNESEEPLDFEEELLGYTGQIEDELLDD